MVKAVVAGASGGIGQPLSLLLKASPLIDELALYDVVNTPGVAADLSHISSPRGKLPISLARFAVSPHRRVPCPGLPLGRLPHLTWLTRWLFPSNRRSPATCPPTTAPRPLSRMPTSLSSPLAFPVRITSYMTSRNYSKSLGLFEASACDWL
ncbi:uncharacterized protein TrAtP1_009714 [Trichoderma atroviride]|uniref:uncharacterized protein n=1 Tax=Hypocrea atroviridis TaxID=63577 RepID=UPI0033343C27|nr:hypothetical protein TrAtP1_009714 [Trichoderma atroviride]